MYIGLIRNDIIYLTSGTTKKYYPTEVHRQIGSLNHSGWTPFHSMYENSTLCTKWFVHQANAAGTFIVHQANAAGAFIVHQGNVVEQLQFVHKVERSSHTMWMHQQLSTRRHPLHHWRQRCHQWRLSRWSLHLYPTSHNLCDWVIVYWIHTTHGEIRGYQCALLSWPLIYYIYIVHVSHLCLPCVYQKLRRKRADITVTTILVPYLQVKSLQLIWRSGTRRFHLGVPGIIYRWVRARKT